jgi:hypothetical protein
MQTTKRCLHLAGTVYREEAEALEGRMLGKVLPTLYPPESTSPDLVAPERMEPSGFLPDPA